MRQLLLIEPTGGELLPLILGHLRKADACRTQATLCRTRGFVQSVQAYEALAAEHLDEADELEMLLTLEALGGVHA